jgi:hypothetical protein
VAFQHLATGLVVGETAWGPTTGKHLNYADGGDREAMRERVDLTEFNRLFEVATSTYQINELVLT